MHRLAVIILAVLFLLTDRAFAVDVLEALFPEAAKMPAPAWMKPGARLTWYDSDSIQYADPKKRGASGHGYRELFVVAVEEGKVVFEERTYFIAAPTEGPAKLVRVRGLTHDKLGVYQRYWIHPDALRKAVETPPAETIVARGEIEHNGRKRKSINVRYGKESEYLWFFDEETGLVLKRAEAHVDKIEQRKSGSLSELRDRTQLSLPWAGQRNPSWIGRISEIRYGGARTDKTAPGVAMSVAVRFQKKVVGTNWVLFDYSAANGMNPAQAEAALDAPDIKTMPFIAGGGSPSSLWIDPKHLAGLTKGQRIMRNAVTGMDVTVFYVGPDQGRDICVLRWNGRFNHVDYVFDRGSGGLLRNVWQDKTVRQDIVMRSTR